MENYSWIVLAAAMQAFLTVAVLLLMAARRRRAFAAGKVGGDAMLNDRSWPDDVLKASNNYRSQFEIPVLFFAAVAVALATGITSNVFTVLCWLFVAARIVHSIVHCGPNVLAPRFASFLVSVIAVSGLWIIIAKRMLVGL
jgi:hypothetical protein